MSFDNLWEKYGDNHPAQSTEQKVENIHHKKTAEQHKEYKKEVTITKKEPERVHQNDDSKSMTGIFGTETKIKSEEPRPERRRDWDFGALRNWPWVDIIFGTITVVMIIGVGLNFEKVTTALFNALLPMLCNIIVLLFVVGLIIFLIWWFTRRRRRRWW